MCSDWSVQAFLAVRQQSLALVGGYFVAAVASFTHLLTKLVFAAPASFLSAACAVQVLFAASVASFMHFFTKLVLAAPASFFSAACASQLDAPDDCAIVVDAAGGDAAGGVA